LLAIYLIWFIVRYYYNLDSDTTRLLVIIYEIQQLPFFLLYSFAEDSLISVSLEVQRPMMMSLNNDKELKNWNVRFEEKSLWF